MERSNRALSIPIAGPPIFVLQPAAILKSVILHQDVQMKWRPAGCSGRRLKLTDRGSFLRPFAPKVIKASKMMGLC